VKPDTSSSRIVAQRQAELQNRLDPRWQPETVAPVLSTSSIQYEVSGRVTATKYGGLGLVVELVKDLGLAKAIDDRLVLLQRHKPYQDSDHILNMTYNFVTGGSRLDDLEQRRNDLGYLNSLEVRRIPGPTTAGDYLRRFKERDVETLMDLANDARLKVWRNQPKASRDLALIDIDGTIAEITGNCKEGAGFAYNGKWGYGPLVVSLANTQEVLYVVNRSASRPSHDGAVKWIDKAIDLTRAADFSRVRLRGDTDFSLTSHFDRWTENDVEFNFGIDAHPTFVDWANEIEEKDWAPLARQSKRRIKTKRRRRPQNVRRRTVKEKGYKNLRLDSEHIAEIPYSPKASTRVYRMIILRKNITVEKGERRLFDEIRYFFYVTNVPYKDFKTAKVIHDNNKRCNQENLIEQLKNGVKALQMPTGQFVANWAYMAIGALAWNLKVWLGLALPRELGSFKLITMEFRKFVEEVIEVPAQILNSGRRLIYRLLAWTCWGKTLIEGGPWIKRLRCNSS